MKSRVHKVFDIRQTTSGPKSRVNKTSSTLKLVKLKLIIKTHNVSFHDGDLMNSNIMNKNNVLNKKNAGNQNVEHQYGRS